MSELRDMNNIGKVLEALLIEIGVHTPQELIRMGSRQAFLNIRSIDSSACIRMLYGLEGAVREIKDTMLPENIKSELKEFYRSL